MPLVLLVIGVNYVNHQMNKQIQIFILFILLLIIFRIIKLLCNVVQSNTPQWFQLNDLMEAI
jgi:hypothetical protein